MECCTFPNVDTGMTEVLTAPVHGASHFSSDIFRSSSQPELRSSYSAVPYPPRSTTISVHKYQQYELPQSHSAPSTAPSSPQLTYTTSSRRPSSTSTPASILSLDPRSDFEDDEIQFPSFEGSSQSCGKLSETTLTLPEDEPPPHPSVSPREANPELPQKVNDDHAVEREPTRHVDYLSHEWKEEDIWSSWRYVVGRRKNLANSTRLENAAWRTWIKVKNDLRTVSPEKLNWLKDCDVTWLYGPLQTDQKHKLHIVASPPPSQLSRSSSFVNKKPILKKKSASAVILERSLSQQSLLSRAGAILRAQQSSPGIRPPLDRGLSDFGPTTYTESPLASRAPTPAESESGGTSSTTRSFTWTDLHSPSESKHVNFDDTVRQVRAIESNEDEKEEQEVVSDVFSDDEDDDGGLMMKPPTPKHSNRSTPRGSFSDGCKTIAALPSTTLKYRTDTPEPGSSQYGPAQHLSWLRGRKLSPSPSQETLRPPRPSHNFLIDDTDEDPEITGWASSSPSEFSGHESAFSYQDAGPGMRRTESGMFMPYDENEAEAALNNSIFRKAINVASTVKDIGYVVWNVGWNKKTT